MRPTERTRTPRPARTSRVRLAATLTMIAAVLAGCQKPYFMTELDYVHYNEVSADYVKATYDTGADGMFFEPRTVLNPGDAEPKELSLAEAKRLALANNKEIAVLGYQPGEAGTNIELALAEFDTVFEFGGGWSRNEQQVSNAVQTIGTDSNAITTKSFGGQVGFGANTSGGAATQPGGVGGQVIPGANTFGITKKNATGGITSVEYRLDYTNTRPVNAFTAVNPAWNNRVEFRFDQPLLQGAGVEFNRSNVLIARSNHTQQIKAFETQVRTLLRDVENAYWQLYFAYQDKRSREVGLRQALITWQREKARENVGKSEAAQVAQTRDQYETFNAQLTISLDQLLEAERAMRLLMGLPPEDGYRLIPADPPVQAAYETNTQVALRQAMNLRPELSGQRMAIRAAELELFRQRNGLLPDLSFNTFYAVTGLDNQYDQSIDRLTDHDFSQWFLGFRYRRPLGERAANASVRNAELALSRQRATLRNLEHQILHELSVSARTIQTNYKLIGDQRDRRLAVARQLEAIEERLEQGSVDLLTLLTAQTNFSNALRDENQAIVNYNQALVQWEFAKGTILEYDNVSLLETGDIYASPAYLEDRAIEEETSLPLPIHPGSTLHLDYPAYPEPAGPLYDPQSAAEVRSLPTLESVAPDPKTPEAPEKERQDKQAAPEPAPEAAPRPSEEDLRDRLTGLPDRFPQR